MTDTQPMAPTDAEIFVVAREAGLLPDNSHPAPETRAARKHSNAVQAFARAVLAKFGTPPAVGEPVAVPLTGEMVSKAGRALSDLYATECGIDKEDNWKVYGSDFIETAKLVLAAAHGIKGGQHGADTK